MGNALLLPGKPSRERYFDPELPKPHEANWFPWLKHDLEQVGIPTEVLAFPEPYDPRYPRWLPVFDSYEVSEDTILVGHSAGAGFIVRWLSEHPDITVAQVHLVAYYHDFENKYVNFSKRNIDPNLAQRTGSLVIYNSLDDTPNIQKSVKFLKGRLNRPYKYREFHDYGHFMLGNNMTTPEFPELRDEILAA